MKHRATTWPELRFVTCPKSEDWWRFFKIPLHQVRPKKHGRKPPSTQWPLYFFPLVNAYTFQLQRPATRRQSHAKAIFAKARISPHEKETIRGGADEQPPWNDNPWDPPIHKFRQPGSELHQTYTFLDPASSWRRLWICHSAEANRLIPCMTMG